MDAPRSRRQQRDESKKLIRIEVSGLLGAKVIATAVGRSSASDLVKLAEWVIEGREKMSKHFSEAFFLELARSLCLLRQSVLSQHRSAVEPRHLTACRVAHGQHKAVSL